MLCNSAPRKVSRGSETIVATSAYIFARDSGSRNTCKSGPRESLKILTDARFRQRFATWRAYWSEQRRISGLRPHLPSRTVVPGA